MLVSLFTIKNKHYDKNNPKGRIRRPVIPYPPGGEDR